MRIHHSVLAGWAILVGFAARAAPETSPQIPLRMPFPNAPVYSPRAADPTGSDRPTPPDPAASLSAGRDTRPYVEEQRRESWLSSLFLRPAYNHPSNQLAHARSLRDSGRPRGAARAYRALVNTWPAAPEAVAALLERARLLEERGLWDDAFDAYQELISRYPGRFDFSEVITRQIRLADRVADRRSMRWLFGGFSTPERALPLYAQILTNAPNWSGAPAVALKIGRIHEENGDLPEAIAAYAEVRVRYPDSPEAEEAAARRIECLWRLVRRAPNHTAVLDEAWGSIRDFLARYPQSPRAPDIRRRGEEVAARRARVAFEAARLYDKPRYSNDVIRTAYERFLAQFPDSPWAPAARRRIAELGGRQEPQP